MMYSHVRGPQSRRAPMSTPMRAGSSARACSVVVIALLFSACSKNLDRGQAASLISEHEGFKKTILGMFVEGTGFCDAAFIGVPGVLLGEGLAQFRPDPQNAAGSDCIVSLTEKGKTVSKQWQSSGNGWQVPLAQRQLVEVTGLTSDAEKTSATAEFTWRWVPEMGHIAVEPGIRAGAAGMRLYDDGWRVLNVAFNPRKPETVSTSSTITQAEAIEVLRRDIYDKPAREKVHIGAECVNTNVWFPQEQAEAERKRTNLRQLAASGIFAVEDLGKTPPCYAPSGAFGMPPMGLPVTFAIDLTEKGSAAATKWIREENAVWVPLHEGSQVENVTDIIPLNAEGSYVRVSFLRRRQQLSDLARARGVQETVTGTWSLVKFANKWGAAKYTVAE